MFLGAGIEVKASRQKVLSFLPDPRVRLPWSQGNGLEPRSRARGRSWYHQRQTHSISFFNYVEFGWETLWVWIPNTPEKQAKFIYVFPGPFSGNLGVFPITRFPGSPWSNLSGWGPFLSNLVLGTLATAGFPYTGHCLDNCCDISFLFSQWNPQAESRFFCTAGPQAQDGCGHGWVTSSFPTVCVLRGKSAWAGMWSCFSLPSHLLGSG